MESYSLPAKGELDPTAIMAPFYYLLFGLMLSDAAYGLIMVFGCLYIHEKYKNLEPGMKKNMKLFLYCGISTTFWGFMFGSFFGDAVNIIATTFFNRPDIRLAPLWFEPISYPMRMLVFSFAFGIVHLFTGWSEALQFHKERASGRRNLRCGVLVSAGRRRCSLHADAVHVYRDAGTWLHAAPGGWCHFVRPLS